MQTTTNHAEQIKQLGFSLESVSEPVGIVSDGWQCIRYWVTLAYKGKTVLQTEYSLGIGHVKLQKHVLWWSLTEEERGFLEAWQGKPNANFQNKELQARIAGKLAKAQKVTPSLESVVHSLLLDGQPYFNNESFEEWAANFGYDTDSRKAESTYRTCMEIGRKIKAAVPNDVIEKAQEILQDY